MVMPYVEPTGRSCSLEMNFYYNLPAFSTGGCSDSKLLDEQAIMETTLSLYYSTLRGGNMIHGLGYIESGLTGSLESVVICDEIISWLKTSLQGLEINEETLALDVIDEILGAEPGQVLPPDLEKEIGKIAEKVLAAQTN